MPSWQERRQDIYLYQSNKYGQFERTRKADQFCSAEIEGRHRGRFKRADVVGRRGGQSTLFLS